MFRLSTRPGLRTFACLLAIVAITVQPLYAGHQFFRNNSVGGVKIDAEGVLSEPEADATLMYKREQAKAIKGAAGNMAGKTEMRKISLKKLEAAIDHAIKNNLGVLPEEITYLAGLQRIEFVFVYPEENDIVLAGPGENWKTDDRGNVVGVTTGRPVIHLDDLLIALRSAEAARTEGISCSIDPTEQGRKNLDALLRELKVFDASVPARIEQAMGPQQITLTGVDPTSHFARVLVAADYRMKRYGMNIEEAPVKGLLSFIDMSGKGGGNMMPRWWMACNYEGVGKSDDGLAWQLKGQGVKVMTEQDFIDNGKVSGTGKKDAIAQKWADTFTAKYDELSTKDIVFGELRNLFDMCIISAIIDKEGLLEKASCQLPLLMNKDSMLMTDSWNPPKTVGTISSATKKGRQWVITASGGVQIESWQVAETAKVDENMKAIRTKASQPEGAAWWWN